MTEGQLYFIKDEFYEEFKDCGLLGNKEQINGQNHNRPCCYLFKYDNSEIYWMVPISSKVNKYKNIYNRSIEKYNKCDNISFCYVLGEQKAILPQNLFPVTKEYIGNIYIDKNTSKPITLPQNILAEVKAKARKKIRYNMNEKKFGMSDVMKIYNKLI